jgi:anti-sigma B factor antagonist
VEPQQDRFNVTPSTNGWAVAGEIDAVSGQQLAQAFEILPDVLDGPVDVDLAAVTFIDSSGLRVLLGLADRVEAAGGTTVIRNPSKHVSRLLAITQLESRFGLT